MKKQNSTIFTLIDTQPDFIIINKNVNVDFHQGVRGVGLCERIREQLQIAELYPVHRLDTMTSGLMLFARNRVAASQLAKMFAMHTIEKYYCAIAGNKPKKKQGTIAGDMVPLRNGMLKLTHAMTNPAVTQFFSSGLGNGYRLYIVKIRTGKTHQIRVALKSIGVPVLGDPLYNKENSQSQSDRPYLHSYAMRFTYRDNLYSYVDIPDVGTYFTDSTINTVWEQYRQPWNLPWPKNSLSR
jgi:tRNA pseudouridine32 synthase/23S rRNA pseudouridine746 synthase